MIDGTVRAFFGDRSFGYLRDSRTGLDTWFHKTDVIGDIKQLANGAKVRYDIDEYEIKGQQRKKAVKIEIVSSVAPAKNPEYEYVESAPASKPAPIQPEPVKVFAVGGQGTATPTAARSLAFDSARTTKRTATPKAVAILADDNPTIRVRGSQPKLPPTDSNGGE
jgi:cold shock CspA family protein